MHNRWRIEWVCEVGRNGYKEVVCGGVLKEVKARGHGVGKRSLGLEVRLAKGVKDGVRKKKEA